MQKFKAMPSHLLLSVALVSATSLLSSVAQAKPMAAAETTPADVVKTLEESGGVHPGQRRNHIKGTCAVGSFVGTSDAAKYSSSALFSGKEIPVVARFSLAGGNPDTPDAARSPRGLALEFSLPQGSIQHITMLNQPIFVTAQPTVFNALLIATKADPKTGQPDPQTVKAFFTLHPEVLKPATFFKDHNPPENYYSAEFYGIHTFKMIDTAKVEHLVKWRFVPQDGAKPLTDDELKAAPHDFLEKNLIAKVSAAPAKWDMIVSVGEPGDAEVDATKAWPEDRKHFKAGTLTISAAMPQKGAACETINFDPLVMAPGIAPTNDPILLFRSPAYAISFGKRMTGQ